MTKTSLQSYKRGKFIYVKVHLKIDHSCDESGMDLDITEEEVYVTYIHSTNAKNNISMNYDANVSHKYYAHLLSSNKNQSLSSYV